MKVAIHALAVLLAFLCMLSAGESGVTYVYQVCDGLGSDKAQLARIYCHNYHAHTGIPPFSLITAPNLPPSNSPKPLEDHNILSASHISISVTTEEPWIVTVDASKASIPQRFSVTLPELLDLTSEAISKTAREWNINYTISLKSPLKAEQDAAANP